MTGKKISRAALALGLVAALVPMAIGGVGGAVAGLPLICRGSAVLSYADGVPDTISIDGGVGLCTGNLSGTYTLVFSGAGTATGLGLCEEGDDPPIVQSLDLAMSLHLVSTGDGHVLDLDEHWSAPVTLFPLLTPFDATDDSTGETVGGGYVSTRIFLNCAPGGRPASSEFRIRVSPE